MEDDFSTRDLVLQIIQEDFSDFSAVGVENGTHALEILKKENVVICITDGRMPLMDGFALMSLIKKSYPHIGIIFVTACQTEFKRADAFYLGADDYIEKPFDIETLSSAVKSALEKRGHFQL